MKIQIRSSFWRLNLEERPLQSAERVSQFIQNPIAMATACKHPRVRIVSRHEDSEFVECLECGEVFDSEEFHDMMIEENADKVEEDPDKE